ncbi:hypothetical protein [Agrococcus sp. HG114]|uniref:hypothetical protein n=1 Tax=Agrococcus sp. HG114 TaxID=2969757 RepID=UPI00215A2A83|nr:hypothetical protein [Agrococcus sp. HG114]MCR8671180.1 hypothetical protein [Agrococcus sp. HG114]
MTRFAIDAPTALRIVRERVPLGEHRLVGTGALRSQVMQLLADEVRAGSLDEPTARAELEALAGLTVRLLADRVSRATAWRIARRLDWAEIAPAELLAVASLQADVLVTDDDRLAAGAEGVVERMRWAEFAAALS